MLFDEIAARLPLFEELSGAALEHLVIAGFGRRLLTGYLRGRLRKAGFSDMAALALATPVELIEARKIGPARITTIRNHVWMDLARRYPGLRDFHSAEDTTARRMKRLQAMPADRLPLDSETLDALGLTGATCATFAMRTRRESLRAHVVTSGQLDRMVSALIGLMLYDMPRQAPPVRVTEEDPTAAELRIYEERAHLLRERDREWEEAAPRRRRGSN
ncbi:hypothetical protein [Methylobacterium brachythecii]|uniref:Uncharacterized protein n=1 Tax=Methylobacterium brachythecii TaxID=1176177 RepID=A0A7W6APQ6_9HYPH|nr:hypothetical protein [Methylobacterium brachythecii]MBB3905694.1 hypothetical protein [Methylobacterium brachythecii]GLS47042.1 hypothetical protein GCM10007884_50430 [Methylobacterium brachythecii]